MYAMTLLLPISFPYIRLSIPVSTRSQLFCGPSTWTPIFRIVFSARGQTNPRFSSPEFNFSSTNIVHNRGWWSIPLYYATKYVRMYVCSLHITVLSLCSPFTHSLTVVWASANIESFQGWHGKLMMRRKAIMYTVLITRMVPRMVQGSHSRNDYIR